MGEAVGGHSVVISQAMYFPWVGMLEQIRLCDTYIQYDDVQLVRGFANRVQIKTSNGTKWLTVPIANRSRDLMIDEAIIDDSVDWRRSHRDSLWQAYSKSPYVDDLMGVVDQVFGLASERLVDVSRASTQALIEYFDLAPNHVTLDSRDLGIPGKGSQRILDLVIHVGGSRYITGHGAANYLEHEKFAECCVEVEYMNYRRSEYPQQFGSFDPHVTALDLVANCGQAGRDVIHSETEPWALHLARQRCVE